jgi:hypothetical protein
MEENAAAEQGSETTTDELSTDTFIVASRHKVESHLASLIKFLYNPS